MTDLDEIGDYYVEYGQTRSGIQVGARFFPFLKEGENPPSGGALCCIPWENRKLADSVPGECMTCGRKVSVPEKFKYLDDISLICIYCVIRAEESERESNDREEQSNGAEE